MIAGTMTKRTTTIACLALATLFLLPVGSMNSAAYSPAKTTSNVYVANYSGNTTSVIRGTHVIKNITVGNNPLDVAYVPTTNEIFVTNYGNASVSVINVTTNKVAATIKNFSYPGLFDIPAGVVYVPVNNMVYVSDIYYSYDHVGRVDAINVTTDRVVASISVGAQEPEYMAFNPQNNYLYVVDLTSIYSNGIGNVTIINPLNNTIVRTVSVGWWPRGIAYDAANKDMYVANSGVPGAIPSSISVINSKFKVSTIKGISTKQPWNVMYDSKDKEVYVTDYTANVVYVINSNNSLVQTMTGFDNPTGIAINTSNNEIYVSNAGNDTVSILKGSNTIASVGVGSSPYGIAAS